MTRPPPAVAMQTAPWLWPTILVVAFVVLATAGAVHHTMWRDEIQAWLIARDSNGLRDLIWNLRYEGHPPLWHLVLMPLTRFAADPRLMHVPVILCMTAVVALVLWRAPMTRVEKILFPFGYFVLFEYGVKSRSYALGALLLIVFCCLWQQRRRHPFLLAATLVLLAQVHILCAILAAAAFLAIVAARLWEDGDDSLPGRAEVLATLIFALGWLAAVALPAHAAITGGATTLPRALWSRLGEIASVSALLGPSHNALTAVPALAIIVATLVALRHRPAALVFLVVALTGTIGVFFAVYGSNTWHRGLLFLAFIVAIWLARIQDPAPTGPGRRLLSGLVLSVLCAQALTGPAALWTTAREPLSRARDTAAFIRTMGWEGDPLVGMADDTTSAVVGHLGVARAFYANAGRWGSFVLWDRRRLVPRSPAELLAEIAAVPTPHTLVARPDFASDLIAAAGYREMARFTGATDPLENYVIWRKP